MYGASGLVLAVVLHLSMVRLGVAEWASALATITFTTGPVSVLYENWLFYDYPVAVALALAFWLLLRARDHGRLRDWGAFFGVLAVVVLVRSAFGLAWLVGTALLALLLDRRRARTIAVGALLPLVLVAAVCLKNRLVFGSFGTSTWLGMSLAKMTVFQISPEERARLVLERRVSGLGAVPPFSELPAYEPFLGQRAAAVTGVRVLDERRRSTGANNYHHRAYVEISRQYLADSIVVFRTRPGAYIRALRKAMDRYFTPPTTYPAFLPNIEHMTASFRFYEATFYRPAVEIVVFSLAFLHAAVRGLRRGASPEAHLPWLFLALNLAYVTAVGTLFELGENNRFRLMCEPLAVIGFMAWARSAWEWTGRWR